MTDPVLEQLGGEPYRAYVYGYPHKTAYRPFARERRLAELFAGEPTDALFLYLHVPFCERRCGYCNLFARAGLRAGEGEAYLAALRRQARAVRRALPAARFARLAVGGGTPSALGAAGLDALLALAEEELGAACAAVPASVELSPAGAAPALLDVLERRGAARVSLGVQSFAEAELRAIGRPRPAGEAEAALERLRARRFPVLSVDLMYGIPGQDERSFAASLAAALAAEPEEVFLYPLYVRAGTPLHGRAAPGSARRALYRLGRDLLAARGYRQRSMRQFTRPAALHEPGDYRYQDDGMIGLGCGARSYTSRVHWSEPYAVDPRGVAAILSGWMARTEEDFLRVRHGFELDEDDARRRWVLLGLLAEGVDRARYRARFGGEPERHLPELDRLSGLGLTVREGELLRLSALGLELSDAVGPALFSPRVRALMAEELAA